MADRIQRLVDKLENAKALAGTDDEDAKQQVHKAVVNDLASTIESLSIAETTTTTPPPELDAATGLALMRLSWTLKVARREASHGRPTDMPAIIKGVVTAVHALSGTKPEEAFDPTSVNPLQIPDAEGEYYNAELERLAGQ